jgi:hypothetical protein
VTELGVLSQRHTSYDVNAIYLEGTYQRNESLSQGRFGASSTQLGAESRQNSTWKMELRSAGPLRMTTRIVSAIKPREDDEKKILYPQNREMRGAAERSILWLFGALRKITGTKIQWTDLL